MSSIVEVVVAVLVSPLLPVLATRPMYPTPKLQVRDNHSHLAIYR